MKNSRSEKVWRTIRALRTFTLDDLQTITGVSRESIKGYVALLKAGGYLRVTKTKGEVGRRYTYMLAKDTGTLAPTMRTCLYDPNTGEFILRKG